MSRRGCQRPVIASSSAMNLPRAQPGRVNGVDHDLRSPPSRRDVGRHPARRAVSPSDMPAHAGSPRRPSRSRDRQRSRNRPQASGRADRAEETGWPSRPSGDRRRGTFLPSCSACYDSIARSAASQWTRERGSCRLPMSPPAKCFGRSSHLLIRSEASGAGFSRTASWEPSRSRDAPTQRVPVLPRNADACDLYEEVTFHRARWSWFCWALRATEERDA